MNSKNSTKYRHFWMFLALLPLGCSMSDGNQPGLEFPEQAILHAETEGIYQDRDIQCLLSLLIVQVEDQPNNNHEIYATMGGEAYRAFSTEGDGIAFWGNSFDSVKIAFPDPGKITINSRIHEPEGETRFWDNILSFEGEEIAEQHWMGTWKCFPMDTRGDTVGIIDGTWSIEAIDG